MLVSDRVLNIKIKSALGDDLELRDADIRVTVLDGVATLEGVVADERARERAGHLTERVYGVEEVDNRLRYR